MLPSSINRVIASWRRRRDQLGIVLGHAYWAHLIISNEQLRPGSLEGIWKVFSVTWHESCNNGCNKEERGHIFYHFVGARAIWGFENAGLFVDGASNKDGNAHHHWWNWQLFDKQTLKSIPMQLRIHLALKNDNQAIALLVKLTVIKQQAVYFPSSHPASENANLFPSTIYLPKPNLSLHHFFVRMMLQSALNIEKVDKTNHFQPLRINEDKAINSWFWTYRASFAV